MKISKDHSKIRTSFLKELIKLQRQQTLLAFNKIANFPSIAKLPEIRKILKELNANDKKKATDKPKPKSETLNVQRVRGITNCLTTPYEYGVSLPFDHPVTISSPDEKVLDVFNPFCSANPFTGEMSLSVISGQNSNDFYGGGVGFDAFGGILGYYKTACGVLSKKVTLPSAYGHDSPVEINVKLELPLNYSDVVELIPGDPNSSLNGLVGARGYLDVYCYYVGASGASSNNFLFDWKTANASVITPHYEFNPSCTHSFMLPPNIKEFWIQIHIHVHAHSAIPNNANNASAVFDYALIDFRDGADQVNKIIRNVWNNQDHVAPGPIKIKSVCLTMEPFYSKLPDTR